MKKFLVLTTLLASATLAVAQTLSYDLNMTPGEDGGGARSGSGSGTLTYDTAAHTLTFNNIPWSGLSANSTASHIHGPSGPFPASANVLYPLNPTFTTVGGTSGTISGTLALVDGTGGFTIAQQEVQLNSSLWYINVHSTAFLGGEIRGTITPVPEPSTLALGGLGLVGFLYRLRRRR